MSLIKAGLKRDFPGRSTDVEIQSFIKSSVQLTGYKCQMDPMALGLKGISADHGRDIRLAQSSSMAAIAAVNLNNTDYKTAQNPSSRKIVAKLTISPTCPLPISISTYEPGHDNGGDLGGIGMGVLPKTNDDDVHKVVVTDITTESNAVATGVVYNGGTSLQNCFWPVSSRHVVITSTGVIWVTWTMQRGAVNDVYWGYSLDGGKTWTTGQIDSSFAPNKMATCLTVDKNDTVHFAWTQFGTSGTTTNCVKHRSVSLALAWSSITIVSIDPNPSGYQQVDPCILVQNDGLSLGVAWCAIDASTWANVYYRERNSVGAWGSIQQVTNYSGADCRGPAFDYDVNTKPHMIFSYGSRTSILPSDIYYTNRVSGSWSAATHVNTEHNGACFGVSNLLVDLSGKIHLSYLDWYDGSPPTKRDFIYKQIVGGVIGSAELVAVETGSYVSKQIDNNGNVVFVWSKYGDGYKGSWRIRNSAGTYSAVTDFFTTTGKEARAMAMIWARLPQTNNIYQQLLQQGFVLIHTRNDAATPTTGEIYFYSRKDSICGAPDIGVQTKSYTTRNRGLIATSSKNIIGRNLIR